MCQISGSTQKEITWLGYFKCEERTASALEAWLKRREAAFEPRWQHLSTQTYYVVGRSYGCSRSPEIFQLRVFLDDVVAKASDDEIGKLVEVLRKGSNDEQKRTIQEISEVVFERIRPERIVESIGSPLKVR